MNRSDRKYVAVLALLFAAAVAAQVLAPRPVDWSATYARDDTIPYGSRVPFDVLDDLLGAPVTPVDLPPYLVLRDTLRRGSTYLFVTDAFAPDPAEAEALLAFAARGNTVFVAAHGYGGALADTLGVEVAGAPPVRLPGGEADTLDRVRLVNPAFGRAASFAFREGTADRAFARVDTARTTVLGTAAGGAANYVRVPWGDGAFLLGTVPLAFTNYNLLEGGNAGYVAALLSYLPAQPVLWDEHHKPGRVAETPLRYVLAEPALRWAYYVGLATLLLFVAFRARRRQRAVPVVPPLRNTTLDFVATVGRLYYQRGDHADLAAKKVAFFLDYVRTHLRLPTARHDAAFQEQLAARAGVPPATVRDVFDAIARVEGRRPLPEAELVHLARAIERFHAARSC